jgi:hypothetical protein
VDQRRFNRATAAVVTGTGRRWAIAGLLAGTAAVFGRGADTAAKKGKKKKCKKKSCTHCPQRACCSCAVNVQQEPTKCSLIEAPSQTDIQEMCNAFCAPDQVFALNFQSPLLANSCAADNRCAVEQCPVKVAT